MKLTTKARYAIMAMVEITKNPITPLSIISKNQNISLPYLEQIFLKLRKAELVKSVRGNNGGYALNRSASNIVIYDIILAVDKPVKMTRCGNMSAKNCQITGIKCITHNLWFAIEVNLQNFLRGITLEDVCENRIHNNLSNVKLTQTIE